MNVRFDGIAGPAAQKLTMACNSLQPMVQACVTALTPGHINWAAYNTWFDAAGNTTPANVQFVRSVLTTVNMWVQTKTFTFGNVEGSSIDHATPGLCAYVMSPTQHMRSGGGLGSTSFTGVDHVGSGVRILLPPRTTANTNELIKTVFHEICHKAGYQIVDNTPNPYDPNTCMQKAQNNPQLAIRNAENYTLFLGAINGI